MTPTLWRLVRHALAVGVLAGLDVAPAGAGPQQTASISGTVVATDPSAGPLRGAVVSATSVDLEPLVRLAAISDDEGRFTIVGLPPGRYTVAAAKQRYLSAAHGARRPGQPGTALAIAAGQHVGGLQFRLSRGAVLTGTIRDASGVPIPNLRVTVVSVEAFSIRSPAPGATFREAVIEPRRLFTVSTNSRGQYRAYDLPSGEYVVTALLPTMGRTGPAIDRSPSAIDAAISALERDDLAAATSVVGSTSARAHAPIFFPGTPLAQEAARIMVSAGEILDGLDFVYQAVPTATVEAIVAWPPGMARETLALSLIPVGVARGGLWPSMPQLDGSDRVTYAGITPGQYLLSATAGVDPPRAWASQEIRVNGVNVSGIALTLQATMTMSGRVVADGLTDQRPSVGRAQVHLSAGLRGRVLRSGVRDSDEETEFHVAGIVPDAYALSVVVPDGSARGWWLESAIAGGRDLLDMPLEFGTTLGSIDDAVLTLTNRRTELTGRLQTPAGQPATDYSVMVFSADRAHWFSGARRTRTVRPSSDGMFSVSELPAGRYLVAAVTDAYPADWQRAEFLEQLAAFAVPVTVRAGETTRQDLQIAGGGN